MSKLEELADRYSETNYDHGNDRILARTDFIAGFKQACELILKEMKEKHNIKIKHKGYLKDEHWFSIEEIETDLKIIIKELIDE